MCGIVAALRFDRKPVDAGLLTRMRDSMFHRGPDDAGLHVDHPVGLGHRRLSIVDLSPLGHQPMCNEDGTLWLVFNGEIYNYVELGALLRQRGHQFRSQTDTEVILHLYEEFGERCVEQLNGMFSFVLWDSRERKLFGARDRFGIKPFHYYVDERQFVCASEIKAILEDPSVPRAADRRGISDYLFAGAPLAGKTFFAGISELPAGHSVVVREGKVRIEEYWDVRYEYRGSRSAGSLTDDLAALLEDSVAIHCRSDAPVGCHLSGGLDSSTVVSLARRHVRPLKSFSIRFDVGGFYDESPFARQMARFAGSELVEATAAPERLAELYPWLLWQMDQPPAGRGDAGYSYYSAARLASEHVKVALTGHGGDEVFAGYPAQFQTAFGTTEGFPSDRPVTRASLSRRVLSALRQEGARGITSRLAGRLRPAPATSPEDLWIQLHCGRPPGEQGALHPGFVASLGGYSPRADYLRPFSSAATDQLLDRCLYHDLRVYLPQLLHKEDRASMAVSLESRVPLLDHRIVEFMATVPPEQKVPGLVSKALLRATAARWLPGEIVERRGKVPFAVPMMEWTDHVLRQLVEEVVHSPPCLERGIYDPDQIRRGRLLPHDLVAILNVELWFRLFIDRDPYWCERARAAGAAAGRISAMPSDRPGTPEAAPVPLVCP